MAVATMYLIIALSMMMFWITGHSIWSTTLAITLVLMLLVSFFIPRHRSDNPFVNRVARCAWLVSCRNGFWCTLLLFTLSISVVSIAKPGPSILVTMETSLSEMTESASLNWLDREMPPVRPKPQLFRKSVGESNRAANWNHWFATAFCWLLLILLIVPVFQDDVRLAIKHIMSNTEVALGGHESSVSHVSFTQWARQGLTGEKTKSNEGEGSEKIGSSVFRHALMGSLVAEIPELLHRFFSK